MQTCPKCGYTRRPTDEAPDYECPSCGIIYARYDPERAEQLEAQRAALRAKAAKRAEAAETRVEEDDDEVLTKLAPAPVRARRKAVNAIELGTFVKHLRDASHYPTFRDLVRVLTILGYGLAALVGIGTVVSQLGGFSLRILLGGFFLTVALIVITRVNKEISLMIADTADAALYIANEARERSAGGTR